jgi:molybdopterin converting factor small subunit
MQVTLGYGSERLQLDYPDGAQVLVSTAIRSLQAIRPDVYRRWCDMHGRIRRSLAVFVNGEHIRYRQGFDTELNDGDEVYIIPVMAGG